MGSSSWAGPASQAEACTCEWGLSVGRHRASDPPGPTWHRPAALGSGSGSWAESEAWRQRACVSFPGAPYAHFSLARGQCPPRAGKQGPS